MIGNEEFGRSSDYEDLAEQNPAGNSTEHVSNILDVVQKISGIVHTECDRSKMISKICGYLLQTRGYPLGIKGDDILLKARILAVADAVEAMSSHRPYRHSLETEAGLEEINRKSGLLYDSTVVSACTEVFEEGFQFTHEAASKNSEL